MKANWLEIVVKFDLPFRWVYVGFIMRHSHKSSKRPLNMRHQLGTRKNKVSGAMPFPVGTSTRTSIWTKREASGDGIL